MFSIVNLYWKERNLILFFQYTLGLNCCLQWENEAKTDQYVAFASLLASNLCNPNMTNLDVLPGQGPFPLSSWIISAYPWVLQKTILMRHLYLYCWSLFCSLAFFQVTISHLTFLKGKGWQSQIDLYIRKFCSDPIGISVRVLL